MEDKKFIEPLEKYKPSLWIKELFNTLGAIYGYKWARLIQIYGIKMTHEWEKDLTEFSGEDISYALRQSKNRKDGKGNLNAFPPDLIEFRSFASFNRKRRQENIEIKKRRENNVVAIKPKALSEIKNTEQFKKAVSKFTEELKKKYEATSQV